MEKEKKEERKNPNICSLCRGEYVNTCVSWKCVMNVLLELNADTRLSLLHVYDFGGLRGTTISFDQVVFLYIFLGMFVNCNCTLLLG